MRIEHTQPEIAARRVFHKTNSAVMQKHNLIHSWLSTELIPGRRKSDALRDLNDEMGTAYTLSRLGEWANGRRPIPGQVRRYMLQTAISWVLAQEGIPTLLLSDAALDRIAERLS